MSVIDDLTNNPGMAARLSFDEQRRVILQCSVVLAALYAVPAERGKDRLLTTDQAAERLGCTRWKLYKHAAEYSFARRDGGRWLFSEHGIDAWIAGKR